VELVCASCLPPSLPWEGAIVQAPRPSLRRLARERKGERGSES